MLGISVGARLTHESHTGLSGTPTIMDNSVFVGAEDQGLYAYTPYGEPVV